MVLQEAFVCCVGSVPDGGRWYVFAVEMRYCDKCKALKPDRAHHCSVCGRLVVTVTAAVSHAYLSSSSSSSMNFMVTPVSTKTSGPQCLFATDLISCTLAFKQVTAADGHQDDWVWMVEAACGNKMRCTCPLCYL